ncbi:MAG TPA: NUDIX domain-containing protein [Micromonosporaceae bacterium]|nr:NUDIX domain-containing protein [Micromonosporaceae bacterium]
MPDEPLRCASAVILDDDGRVFIQRRAPDRALFPGAWDIVGGHLEAGESFAEALDREVFEETGWRVSHVLADLGEIQYQGDDGKERLERQYLIRVDGNLAKPSLAPEEHTEWRWISRDELDVVACDRPGDELARQTLLAAFQAVHDIGLS